MQGQGMKTEYRRNHATLIDLICHLEQCDEEYLPRLSARVDIRSYATKVMNHAVRLEAWEDTRLIGLLAVYCNDTQARTAFITNVSVLSQFQGCGIGRNLVRECIDFAKRNSLTEIKLEVNPYSTRAVNMYERLGFKPEDGNTRIMRMRF